MTYAVAHLGSSPSLLTDLHAGTHDFAKVLANAKKQGELLDAPVFCSGLGVDLIDYFDELHRKTGLVRFSRKLIKELRPRVLPNYVNPHKGGIKQKGIYLVSSGMMIEKTPSYAVAASLFHDHLSSILFVGYCDAETPGGAIRTMNRGDRYLFEALDFEAPLNARVETFDLSGHADREDLLKMAQELASRSVVLTHGDLPARKYFMDRIEASGGVLDPVPLKEYEV